MKLSPSTYAVSQTYHSSSVGKDFRRVVILISVAVSCVIGGLLNRIRGGFLDFPWDGVNNVVALHICRYLIFAIPSGFLVGIIAREYKIQDQYYIRRVFLSLAVFFFVWFGSYIDQRTYQYLGENAHLYKSPTEGLFDWIIGKNCRDFGFGRRWAHDFVGLSLRGLATTLPLGFFLFCCGYGWELVFSGSVISWCFQFGWLIHSHVTDFERGEHLGEFFYGFWLWLCLIAPILSHRKQPFDAPKSKPFILKLIFYPMLFLFQIIMIASCIIFNFVSRDTPENSLIEKYQTLLGICVTSAGLLVIEACYFFIPTKRLLESQTGSAYWYLDEQKSIQNEDSTPTNANPSESTYLMLKKKQKAFQRLLIPQGKKPFIYVLSAVRIIVTLTLLLLIVLMPYVIIADRLMKPC